MHSNWLMQCWVKVGKMVKVRQRVGWLLREKVPFRESW